MSDGRRELRSARYVTHDYRNVFHRAFLYGLGLSETDMQRPFVGLALAHNEAVAGHGVVRAHADVARRLLPRSGLTEREFVVPDVATSGDEAIAARELAADSAELVVRGHWYDGLVGVAVTVTGAVGISQAAVRLDIPSLVMVPGERLARDAALAEVADLLVAAGLGVVVDLDSPSSTAAALTELADRILHGTPVDLGARILDGVWSAGDLDRAELLPHLAALAHEAGVSELALLGGRGASTWGVLNVPRESDHVVVGARRTEGAPRVDGEGIRTVTAAEVARVLSGRVAVAQADAPTTAEVAGITHPGPVAGPMRYAGF